VLVDIIGRQCGEELTFGSHPMAPNDFICKIVHQLVDDVGVFLSVAVHFCVYYSYSQLGVDCVGDSRDVPSVAELQP